VTDPNLNDGSAEPDPKVGAVAWNGGHTLILRCGARGSRSYRQALAAVEEVIRSVTTFEDWSPYAAQAAYMRRVASGEILSYYEPEEAARDLEALERSGATRPPFVGESLGDMSIALNRILRFEKPRAQRHVKDAEAIRRTEFLHIPLSWYAHVTQEYRGARRPYVEAIQILAYVVGKYRVGLFPGHLLWVPRRVLMKLFGLSADAEEAAVRHLTREGLLVRVIVQGLVPWRQQRSGKYRFLVPVLPRIKEITWR
jgi:hypothetical protein